jgi:hemerythrin-like domain-containing protein
MPNVIALIENDHRAVEDLFAKFEQSQDPKVASKICDELTKHAAGEEQAVYPVIERRVRDGKQMVDEAVHEHNEARQLIGRARLATEAELPRVISELKRAIQHHVHEEEQQVLPKTSRALDQSLLQQMGQDFERAKRAAGSARSPWSGGSKVSSRPGQTIPQERPRAGGTARSPRSGYSRVSRRPVHTIPHQGGWANRREGASRVSKIFRTKRDAEAAGRKTAQRDGVEHVVHNRDGKLTERNSYGNDPVPARG